VARALAVIALETDEDVVRWEEKRGRPKGAAHEVRVSFSILTSGADMHMPPRSP
jgi:hypothetical protein